MLLHKREDPSPSSGSARTKARISEMGMTPTWLQERIHFATKWATNFNCLQSTSKEKWNNPEKTDSNPSWNHGQNKAKWRECAKRKTKKQHGPITASRVGFDVSISFENSFIERRLMHSCNL